MSEHLKMIKENSYLKLCIIQLIEELDKYKELNAIKRYLRDVIDGVEENTTKNNNYFKHLIEKGDSNEN